MIEGGNAALKQDNLTSSTLLSSVDEQQADQQLLQEPELDLSTAASTNGQTSSVGLTEPPPVSGAPGEPSGAKTQPRRSMGWLYILAITPLTACVSLGLQ